MERGRPRSRTRAFTVRASGVVLAAIVVAATCGAASGEPGFPRVANIHFPCIVGYDENTLWRLSRYDVVVMSLQNDQCALDEMAAIRSDAPDIILLPHMPFSYHGDWAGIPVLAEMRDALYDNNWWLRDTSGEIFRTADGNGLVNITLGCPTDANGDRLCDWLGEHIANHLGPGGAWDGVFLDCVWDEISWAVHQLGIDIDSDLDGQPDDLAALDESWRQGTAIAVAELRDLVGPDYLLVSNGGNTCWEDLNGSTLEGFPQAPNGWYLNIVDPDRGYIAIDTNYREPRYNIINPNWWGEAADENGPLWAGNFIRKFLFTFANCLIFGDGYYSINTRDYAETWWFPYYDLDLGVPLGPFEDALATPGDAPGVEYGDMIKQRLYSNGMAVINPTDVEQDIELPGTYYDPEAMDDGYMPVGSVLTAVTLSPHMGRVLVGTGTLRPAAMGLVSAAFDGAAVDLSWDGPSWASRYAVYRRGVRGDGSMTERVLIWLGEDTTCRDIRVCAMRRYAYSVAPIDASDCEGWPSDPVIVSTEVTVEPSIALMVEDPGDTLIVWWSPPDVPGEMIFELERHGDHGAREWLGRFTVKGGRVVRYADETAAPGRGYTYELFEIDGAERRLVGWVRARGPAGGGGATALLGCRPQPISVWPATIAFRIGDDDNWEGEPPGGLTVYDTRGRVVRRLIAGPLSRGDHSVAWDGLDGAGRPVASGCYLYALEVGGRVYRGKAVVIR